MLKITGDNPILKIIGRQIMEISNGNFNYVADLLPDNNEFNLAIAGLNMLSEEIKDITISRKFFNDVFDSSPDIFMIVKENGMIRMSNKEAKKILKRINNNDDDINNLFLYSNYNHLFCSAIKEIKNTSKTFVKEIYLKILDEYYSLKIKQINKIESEYIVSLTNISLIKSYQERIESSEHKYRSIFEISNNSIFLMSTKGYLMEANTSFYKFTGIRRKSKVYLGDFVSFDNQSLYSIAKMLVKKTQINNLEITILNKKQDKRLIALLSLLEITDNKNQKMFLGILKDITSYKTQMTLNARVTSFAQEKIRKQIAFELHDSIGQQLSAIRFMTNSLKSVVKENSIQEKVEMISSNILNTIQELRDICFNLMPASLQAHGLENTVREMISRLKSVSDKINFKLKCTNVSEKLPLDFAVNAYRIIQEIISNALKHSNCTLIEIEITGKEKRLSIVIKDNGKGFDFTNLKKLSGTGMKSIQSRVNFYNGTLKFKKNDTFALEYHIVLQY